MGENCGGGHRGNNAILRRDFVGFMDYKETQDGGGLLVTTRQWEDEKEVSDKAVVEMHNLYTSPRPALHPLPAIQSFVSK